MIRIVLPERRENAEEKGKGKKLAPLNEVRIGGGVAGGRFKVPRRGDEKRGMSGRRRKTSGSRGIAIEARICSFLTLRLHNPLCLLKWAAQQKPN